MLRRCIGQPHGLLASLACSSEPLLYFSSRDGAGQRHRPPASIATADPLVAVQEDLGEALRMASGWARERSFIASLYLRSAPERPLHIARAGLIGGGPRRYHASPFRPVP